jgi:hypothetical protein
MHTANLRLECQNLHMVSDLCDLLETLVDSPAEESATGGPV